jgi:ElaB/YqjD/DUF883 family membrane-anchored ribosome-binding protein
METTSTYRDAPKTDDNGGPNRQEAGRRGEEIVRATAEGVAEVAHEARKQFTSALEAAKATYTKLHDKGLDYAKATDQVVRKHPYPSLGVVFGLGVLIGVLSRRRS